MSVASIISNMSLLLAGEPVDDEHAEFGWSWSASRVEGTQLTSIDLEAISSTPTTNKILVIAAWSLHVGAGYRFRLEVNDRRATGLAEVRRKCLSPFYEHHDHLTQFSC